ncbi:MAG: hypothetical protein ACE5KU_02790 [Nitrososphaerales archaeon]
MSDAQAELAAWRLTGRRCRLVKPRSGCGAGVISRLLPYLSSVAVRFKIEGEECCSQTGRFTQPIRGAGHV